MTAEEQQEYTALKHILNDRGFLIKKEQERWNCLFDKNAKSFMSGMKLILNEVRLSELN